MGVLVDARGQALGNRRWLDSNGWTGGRECVVCDIQPTRGRRTDIIGIGGNLFRHGGLCGITHCESPLVGVLSDTLRPWVLSAARRSFTT